MIAKFIFSNSGTKFPTVHSTCRDPSLGYIVKTSTTRKGNEDILDNKDNGPGPERPKKKQRAKAKKSKAPVLDDHVPIEKHEMWNAAKRICKIHFAKLHWDIDNFDQECDDSAKEVVKSMLDMVGEDGTLMDENAEPNKAQRNCAHRTPSLAFKLRQREPLPQMLVECVRNRRPKPDKSAHTGCKDV